MSDIIFGKKQIIEIRPIINNGELAYITLTKGKVAVIDSEDIFLVSGINWACKKTSRSFYARTNIWKDGKRTGLLLHRFLLNAPQGFDVDHIDGDGLNNRRSNLRICTRSENQYNQRLKVNNTTGYKGVSFCKRDNVFVVNIRVDKKAIRIGSFRDAESAYEAYCDASKKYHKDFGRIL